MLVMGYEINRGVEDRAARGKIKSKKQNNEQREDILQVQERRKEV